jgi:dTDP-glucose pyrophosphorylase
MQVSNNICGVILAAGLGSRMGELSKRCPKPLQKVGSVPIISHQLSYMRKLGISEVIIVVNYLSKMIEEYLGDGEKHELHIKYVRQEERLGIAHAVGQLEDLIVRPFLLFLGDIFFIPNNLNRMFEIFYKNNASSVLAVRRETNPEEIQKSFAVILHANGMVRRVIEKPRFIPTDRKGCGIYLFDTVIFDAIRQTPRTAMRDEYEITTTIQKLIDFGQPVYDAEVVEWDINVTFPSDLIKCNEKLLTSNYKLLNNEAPSL